MIAEKRSGGIPHIDVLRRFLLGKWLDVSVFSIVTGLCTLPHQDNIIHAQTGLM